MIHHLQNKNIKSKKKSIYLSIYLTPPNQRKINFILIAATASWKNIAKQTKKITTNLKLKFTVNNKKVRNSLKGIKELIFILRFLFPVSWKEGGRSIKAWTKKEHLTVLGVHFML